jgi:hypothetical protein
VFGEGEQCPASHPDSPGKRQAGDDGDGAHCCTPFSLNGVVRPFFPTSTYQNINVKMTVKFGSCEFPHKLTGFSS